MMNISKEDVRRFLQKNSLEVSEEALVHLVTKLNNDVSTQDVLEALCSRISSMLEDSEREVFVKKTLKMDRTSGYKTYCMCIQDWYRVYNVIVNSRNTMDPERIFEALIFLFNEKEKL